MYRTTSLFLTLFILALFSFSCGGDANDADNADNDDGISITIEDSDGEEQSVNIDLNSEDLQGIQNNIADALQEAANNVREGGGGEDVELMNFRDMKAILPESLIGMDRTKHQGEKSGAMGFTIAQAEADYEDGDKRLSVQIVDAAKMGMAKMGMMAWASIEVDREGDFGYERTTVVDGNKAYEKWDSNTGKGELMIYYDERYIINVNGRNLDNDDLRKVVRKLDLDDLE